MASPPAMKGLNSPFVRWSSALAPSPSTTLVELGPLGVGDRAVGGDDDLVGGRVGRPGGARDGGVLGERRCGRSSARRGSSRRFWPWRRPPRRLGRGLVEHVHDEVLGLGVVVRARRVGAEVLGRGSRRAFRPRRPRGSSARGRRGVSLAFAVWKVTAGGDQCGNARTCHGRTPLGYASVLQLTSSCGGSDPEVWGPQATGRRTVDGGGSHPHAASMPGCTPLFPARREHTRSTSGRAYETLRAPAHSDRPRSRPWPFRTANTACERPSSAR